MERNKLRAPLVTTEVENNWAISYGDMITLLLGFFVIFFNIKSDTMNLALIKKDLDQFFNEKAHSESNQSQVKSSDSKGQKTVPLLTSDIANVLQIKSNLDGERILVEFPGVSFFQSGSSKLTLEGQKALGDFAQALSGHLGLFRLVVRGYTDGKPVQANARYKDNLELSAFRSISAIRHLATHGVNLDKMRIAGYGESSMSREDKANDVQRKVVIVIEPLDHTERVPASAKDHSAKNQKSIEQVEQAQVAQRKPDSVMDHTWFPQMSLDDISFGWDSFRIQIDQKIEQSSLYKRWVDFMVSKELEEKGYSPSQAKDLIKKYDEERGL